jgi:hypothetical protein
MQPGECLEEALSCGRKAVIACRAPVEVRAFLAIPERWLKPGEEQPFFKRGRKKS